MLQKLLYLMMFTLLLSCQASIPPSEVQAVIDMVDYFNENLPPELPRWNPIDEQEAVYLAGKAGERSFLLNPGINIDRDRFPDDTLHTGERWDYLTFYDDDEVSYNYAASVYSPADSSRFGPNASVLEISTPGLFAADNPDDTALGFLSVALHEMGHMTEDYPEPPATLPMMEQMEAFESDSLLRAAVTAENKALLSALAAKDTVERNTHLRSYFSLKAQRVAGQPLPQTLTENYYELVEGYGRFVEHLLQERASGFKNDYLTSIFGPLPGYQIDDQKWMFRIVYNDYFYVLGFNKFRLLAAAGDYSFVESLRGESDGALDDYLQQLLEE